MAEWYNNIPKNGILVKSDDGCIERITHYDSDSLFNGSIWLFPVEDYTPIDSKEWWAYAPWKNIDSAPKKDSILAMNAEGDIQRVIWVDWTEGEPGWGTGFCEFHNPILWLEIPNLF